jgi:hypothetical protein
MLRESSWSKWFARADEPVLITKPQLVQAHLFHMQHHEDRWTLVGLDSPDPAFSDAEAPAGP